eukprot:CAMPEP_0119337456 /NCGR_PEP_ID=MMETSP1333-20130426/94029_1 /TAXON_ID=418940 /ORGANISM="Scyphosphaera apsteinii, Strain RCC1455" /LENGTH=460 /DNA_ID=CAMNT_0007348505 /DNA_START=120 /DNA_END=1499 /DNA_ORIENTATION=+
MPRSFSRWNDWRRPDAVLFDTHGGEQLDALSPKQSGMQAAPEHIETVDLEDLVNCLVDGSIGTGAPEPEPQPQAAVQVSPADVEMLEEWNRPGTSSEQSAMIPAENGTSSEQAAMLPPDAVFEWRPCDCPVSMDAEKTPIEPLSTQSAPLEFSVDLTPPVLYWKERQRWMWHKKWCLPKLRVEVRSGGNLIPDDAGLQVLVSAGTLREGYPGLQDEGLGGKCQLRLVGGSVVFSSLLFLHTSFNCGNRPFHLVITAIQPNATSNSMTALGCICSSAIHVDARKRTKIERPDSAVDDVRLQQRQRSFSSNNTPGGSSRAPVVESHAPPLNINQAAPEAGAQHSMMHASTQLTAAVSDSTLLYHVFDATGNALLEILPDWTVIRVISNEAFRYSRADLTGTSLLAIIHPLEHLPLLQTTQALLAMSMGQADSKPETSCHSIRARHRVFLKGSGAVAASNEQA